MRRLAPCVIGCLFLFWLIIGPSFVYAVPTAGDREILYQAYAASKVWGRTPTAEEAEVLRRAAALADPNDVVEVSQAEIRQLLVNPPSVPMDAIMRNDDNSFVCKLYRNRVNGNYYLAFRGLDINGNALQNVQDALNIMADVPVVPARLAILCSYILTTSMPGKNITLVGASLGGGLAGLGAMATNSKATLFNSIGFSKDTVRKAIAEFRKAMPTLNDSQYLPMVRSLENASNSSTAAQNIRLVNTRYDFLTRYLEVNKFTTAQGSYFRFSNGNSSHGMACSVDSQMTTRDQELLDFAFNSLPRILEYLGDEEASPVHKMIILNATRGLTLKLADSKCIQYSVTAHSVTEIIRGLTETMR